MTKSIRIRTTPNGDDKYIKIKLTQSFDFLEVLSLKLSQAEIYRKFAADYGVIVGRVIANRGFGVPNAKVSIFIPLNDDETDPEIIGRYPFKSVSDTDSNGIRYNLLEDNQQGNCHVPVGTFPNKRKVLDNNVWLEIYDTYYKFTTTTNSAGDYMLFGVPTGNQRIHMDVDISDIEFISMKPYDLMSQGYTNNLFDTNTTFKNGTDLDSLVQIQKRDTNVNVLPFWGDLAENQIGINRVDFNLGIDLTPNAIFFGSIFTNGDENGVHKGCAPRARMGKACSLKAGKGTVEAIRKVSRNTNQVEFIGGNKIDDDGNWAYTIPMNLDPVVTDEFGNLIPSEDPNVGVPTRTVIRFRMALSEHIFGFRKRTAHYLVPNMYDRFDFNSDTDDKDFFEMRWKKIYTVTNYIPRYQKFDILYDESPYHTGIKDIESCDVRPMPFNRFTYSPNPIFSILCVIISVIGFIFNMINDILEKLIFDVVMGIVCFFKHILDGGLQGACRCKACYDLNEGNCPSYWTGGSSTCPDCCICAKCYQPEGGTPQELYGTINPAQINENLTGAPAGTYNNIPQLSSEGSGGGATFNVVVNSGGIVTSVVVVNGGTNYQKYPPSGNGEKVILDLTGTPLDGFGTLKIQTIVSSHYRNVSGCGSYDKDKCNGKCAAQTCKIAFLPLECNGDDYFDGNDWASCTVENLAEDLDVIQYDFYNDWIIGSLYSYMFDYNYKSSGGKPLESFCDFDCRDISISGIDVNDKHRQNICREASIYDKSYFKTEDSTITFAPDSPLDKGRISSLFYKGLISERNGILYYNGRHDDPNLNIGGAYQEELEVHDNTSSQNDKSMLLFATNLIELGSTVTCDIDGEPFIINRMESTSYKKDNGTKTLFTLKGCGASITDTHYNAMRIMSETGIEIVIAQSGAIGSDIIGDDGELYTLNGSQVGLPDEKRNNGGILLFDRDDVILRKHLCENFNYYSNTGVYVNTPYPTSGGSYIESTTTVGSITETYIISGSTDICEGFDDWDKPYKNMSPYYTYFGTNKESSLVKVRGLFFDKCITTK